MTTEVRTAVQPETKVDLTDFFAEIGMADAEELNIKSEAVRIVARGIDERGLKQKDFAALIGWRQPTVSSFVRGQLDLFGWNRVNEALAPFGKRVKLTPQIVDAS